MISTKDKPSGLKPRQLVVRVPVQFALPKTIYWGPLAQRLGHLLETPEGGLPRPDGGQNPKQPNQHKALQWLAWGCELTKNLLQTARLPVFDALRLVKLAPLEGTQGWQAWVEVARVEGTSASVYQLALKTALDALAFLSAPADEPPALDALYAEIGTQFLATVNSKVPTGKSTVPVLRFAHALGIPFVHLGAGVFQLGWGSKARRMDRSTTELDSAMGNRLSHNKAVCANLLLAAGLPAPRHHLVRQGKAAWAAAQEIGLPVVVKPVDLERGEGVSVDLVDENSVRAAFRAARDCSPSRQVLVEKQVQGSCHRLFVAHGRLLYAVRRGPMAVQGDGRQTVAQLVAGEFARQQTRPPWLRSAIQALDALALAELARNGLSEDSVPTAGHWVALRRIETTAWGGIDEELTSVVHPANRKLALRCAELFGLHVAGIDLITPDISQAWWTNGAIVNEVNFAPLMGGGPASLREIPGFLRELMQGDGRIPVHVVVGGLKARTAALEQQRACVAAGLACYFSSGSETLNAQGVAHYLPLQGAFERTRALLLSPKVQALVVWTDSDEFAVKGAPLEFIDTVQVVDRQLIKYQHLAPGQAAQEAPEVLPPNRVDRVLAVLTERLVPSAEPDTRPS